MSDRPTGTDRRRRVLLYVVTPEQYFLSHRLHLAAAAAREGWEVHLAAPPGRGAGEIARRNIVLHRVPLDRRTLSPVQELRSFGVLLGLCRRLRPDLVHAISPKAAVLAGVAARMLGIPAVLMKGGLGSPFTDPGAASAVARAVMRVGVRVGLGPRAALVALNPEEAEDLARTEWMRSRTVLMDGAGVDCEAFRPTPEPPPPITVTFAARMIGNKGVEDFVAAARLLAGRGVRARFLLAGDVDPGSSTPLPAQALRAWDREGCVEWLGQCADMPGLLASSHVVCLASRGGEGLPRVLAEAAAAGRAIVATDVPGCRDVVQDGVNGLLVAPRNPAALADALERLIGSPAARAAFGRAGREIALARFDQRLVIPRMLDLYRSLARN